MEMNFRMLLWKKSYLQHWLRAGKSIVFVNPVWLLSPQKCSYLLLKSVVILGTSNYIRDLLLKMTWCLVLSGLIISRLSLETTWHLPKILLFCFCFLWDVWGYFPTLLCSQNRKEGLFVPAGNSTILLQYIHFFFSSFVIFSNPEVTAHQEQKVADSLLISLALQSW